jgi:hypothetical protein
MRKIAMLVAAMFFVLGSAAALADEYHVYKLGNGECTIDTRTHEQMKSQRSTDNCLGHFSNRTDAEKLRADKVKAGACKCPSGENC